MAVQYCKEAPASVSALQLCPTVCCTSCAPLPLLLTLAFGTGCGRAGKLVYPSTSVWPGKGQHQSTRLTADMSLRYVSAADLQTEIHRLLSGQTRGFAGY
jgi:hypothetical protein